VSAAAPDVSDASRVPVVSVVMGVRDGAAGLPATLRSVLAQEGVDLELVVVDDGSTDATPALLADAARDDRRVRVLTQPHRGLTAALIAGCAAARGRYVARQDAGDVSLPGRLRAQAAYLDAHPEAVLVSCRARLRGPAGELLYESGTAGSARAGLLETDPARISGIPHHGTACFRREAFEAAGGYRRQFYFAQDLDLWVRLAERGAVEVLPEVGYEAGIAFGSISGVHRERQLAAARLILESALLRRAGRDDAAVLARAAAIGPGRRGAPGRRARAAHAYFVASCLRANGDPRARAYYREALRHWPLHARAFAGLLRGPG
jgi:glycosyltransferase involved in cell wall biosynthesis